MVPLPDEVLRAKARQGVSDAELSDFRMKYEDEAKELQGLEVEKQRLQDLLNAIEEKRTTIQQSMHQIVCLTSPISRLSDDIVSHLALYMPNMSHSWNLPQKTWSFAQVNTQWRSVALSARHLWTDIHLVHISTQSPDVLQEVLRRSGGLPLSVKAHTGRGRLRGEDTELIPAKERKICMILSQSSRQWHEIFLQLPGILGSSGSPCPPLFQVRRQS